MAKKKNLLKNSKFWIILSSILLILINLYIIPPKFFMGISTNSINTALAVVILINSLLILKK